MSAEPPAELVEAVDLAVRAAPTNPSCLRNCMCQSARHARAKAAVAAVRKWDAEREAERRASLPVINVMRRPVCRACGHVQ